MKYQSTIFGQLLHFLPRDQFQRIVDHYKGDFKVHKMDCWTQFVSLAYAQLRQRDSLRDIETGLEAQLSKLNHLGIQPVKRSTLSDANNKRDSRIYEEAFHLLLGRCQALHREQNNLRVSQSHLLDGCNDHQPMSQYVSLDTVSEAQRRHQNASNAKPRQWPTGVCTHHRRTRPRIHRFTVISD